LEPEGRTGKTRWRQNGLTQTERKEIKGETGVCFRFETLALREGRKGGRRLVKGLSFHTEEKGGKKEGGGWRKPKRERNAELGSKKENSRMRE